MNGYHIVKDIYPKVNPEDFPELFTQHMSAMTEYGLEKKSDIAIQLAWRDAYIAEADKCIRDAAQRLRVVEAKLDALLAKPHN